MIDSYELFLSKYVSKDDFFNFGLSETIYINDDKVKDYWELLKKNIKDDKPVPIRGFGRDAKGTNLFVDFYAEVFSNSNVFKDSTNNHNPSKIIQDLTALKKGKDIRNYQISHIFGRTKNIYTFTAPWNIVFKPKILDPFTGHEAKGDMVKEYQELFFNQSYKRFKNYIEDYNELITSHILTTKIENYLDKIQNSLSEKDFKKFKIALLSELSPIQPN